MSNDLLSITPDTLYDEIVSSIKILDTLRELVGKKGIPGIDRHATVEEVNVFIRKLAGELMIASGKCSNLASVLME